MGRIRRVLGVDVGLSSAAAAVFGHDGGTSNFPKVLGVFDLPTFGEGGGKRIDPEPFWKWIGLHDPEIGYVEAGNAMPAPPDKSGQRARMNAANIGRYLRACGAIETTVILAGVHMVPVQPATWKRALNLLGTTKDQSISTAVAMVPNARDFLPTKVRKGVVSDVQKYHNRAESILIAVYGAVRCDMIELQA